MRFDDNGKVIIESNTIDRVMLETAKANINSSGIFEAFNTFKTLECFIENPDALQHHVDSCELALENAVYGIFMQLVTEANEEKSEDDKSIGSKAKGFWNTIIKVMAEIGKWMQDTWGKICGFMDNLAVTVKKWVSGKNTEEDKLNDKPAIEEKEKTIKYASWAVYPEDINRAISRVIDTEYGVDLSISAVSRNYMRIEDMAGKFNAWDKKELSHDKLLNLAFNRAFNTSGVEYDAKGIALHIYKVNSEKTISFKSKDKEKIKSELLNRMEKYNNEVKRMRNEYTKKINLTKDSQDRISKVVDKIKTSKAGVKTYMNYVIDLNKYITRIMFNTSVAFSKCVYLLIKEMESAGM